MQWFRPVTVHTGAPGHFPAGPPANIKAPGKRTIDDLAAALPLLQQIDISGTERPPHTVLKALVRGACRLPALRRMELSWGLRRRPTGGYGWTEDDAKERLVRSLGLIAAAAGVDLTCAPI